MAKEIRLGDTVKYHKDFLQSIATGLTDPMWRAKGKVTFLTSLSKETTIATVDWNMPDIPSGVNVRNLGRIDDDVALWG